MYKYVFTKKLKLEFAIENPTVLQGDAVEHDVQDQEANESFVVYRTIHDDILECEWTRGSRKCICKGFAPGHSSRRQSGSSPSGRNRFVF